MKPFSKSPPIGGGFFCCCGFEFDLFACSTKWSQESTTICYQDFKFTRTEGEPLPNPPPNGEGTPEWEEKPHPCPSPEKGGERLTGENHSLHSITFAESFVLTSLPSLREGLGVGSSPPFSGEGQGWGGGCSDFVLKTWESVKKCAKRWFSE